MISALIVAAIVFAIVFVGLLGVEKLIHRFTKNPDRSYRWGVWFFALLAALYAFATSLGRK